MRRYLFNMGRGFTLVELLVVITIIGILVALTLSAVQSAREAARNIACVNNLKQLANGALQHESATGYLPSGGWGWYTIGDPDRGYGQTQPGGWFYNILPFIEQQALHDLGVNLDYSNSTGAPQRIQFGIQLIQTPLAIAMCPTRRRPALYTMAWNGTYVASNYGGVNNPANHNVAARTDYAICCGDGGGTEIDGGASDPGFGKVTVPYSSSDIAGWHQSYTGVSFRCSQIALAQLKGGSNNTILLGDKYDCSTGYYSGRLAAENENLYVGMDNDIFRSTNVVPLSDRSTTDSATLFGSAHLTSCNFAFCDGSVRPLNYSIDLTTYQQLGRRVKTQPIDDSKVH
jgi:prepilin-type N-terminal cleavage/methylation domain-containing protein/prepilin-type processing-associated H-X9-DG protein